MLSEKGSGDDGEEESEEAQKTGGQRSHGDWALKKRTHPAEEKSPERTEAAIEVNVGAAGFGEGGAEFGITEGAREHNESADDPRGENQSSGAHDASHVAGNQENASTDGVANDDGRGGPQAEAANQVGMLRVRDSLGTSGVHRSSESLLSVGWMVNQRCIWQRFIWRAMLFFEHVLNAGCLPLQLCFATPRQSRDRHLPRRAELPEWRYHLGRHGSRKNDD